MIEGIVIIVISLIVFLIGCSNSKGNISSLHSYHTKRIEEENKIIFGKKVGRGMRIVSLGLIFYGATFILEEVYNNIQIITYCNYAGIIFGALGLIVCLSAIIKYNKGLF